MAALFILTALILGIALGVAGAGTGWGHSLVAIAEPVGGLWLNGLRMTVIPLIVALLITGIGKTAEAAKAGRLASRSVLWFLGWLWFSTIIVALLFPLALSAWPLPADAGAALRESLSTVAKTPPPPGIGDFLLSLVPTNPIAAAAGDATLPLVVFTLVFAFAILKLPQAKRDALTGFFDAVGDAMLIMIGWVLALAPAGVFALGIVLGAKSGFSALGALAHYVVMVSCIGIAVFAAAYILALVAGRVSLLDYQRAVLPSQAVAISSQSSLASLPAMLKGAMALGVKPATADLVLPLAVALFRATSPGMNLGVTIYIAHWFGIALSPAQLAAGVAVAAITTIGSVSLPGTISFVAAIAPIAVAMGIPFEPLALLIAVETLPDIFRTLGNVSMDVAVTKAISRQTEGKRAATDSE
jgi:proton glutamate symport protein